MKMRRHTAVTPPVMTKRPLKLCNEIVIEFMLLSGPARIGSFLNQFRSISRIFPFSVSSLTARFNYLYDKQRYSRLFLFDMSAGIVADSNAHDPSKRMRTGGPPPYNPYGGYPVAHMPVSAPAPVSAPSSYAPVQNTKDNPACNTLFIGNLGENINEEELWGLISGQPGFKEMKVLRQERHTVCFIEFEQVNSATNVHQNLQGAVIPSSTTYSKNPFGKRKDFGHPAVASNANGGPPHFHNLEDWIVLESPVCLYYAGYVQKEGTSSYLGMTKKSVHDHVDVDVASYEKMVLVCFRLIDVKNVIFFYLCCFSVSVCALNSHGTALLSLFKHWTAVPSSVKSSWNASDSTPCSWVGVECDTTHLVTSLNLSGYGISGQLGPEIAYLEHLRTIDLSYNAFFGSIPSQLVNCTLLDYLDLSYNTFTGEIPSKIGNLHKLTYISLYANSLTGNIPDSLFSIPHLDSIYLFQNRLIGSIPSSIGNLTKLVSLFLYDNELSGPIPSSISSCTNLQQLYLNENNLVGSLPENLDKLEHLVYLDLSSNRLQGSIPFSLGGNCKDLDTLVLSSNNLNGSLPPSLSNCTNLRVLAAFSSGLSGPIPASLGQLTKLEKLYLADNNFSGKIPPELGKCQSLLELLLPENQLEGEIPSELGSLSQLQYLALYSNKLSGEIPRAIWKIQSLQHFLVYPNNLTGEVPLEMTELKQLKNISSFDNRFTGVIPQGLGINSSLTLLDFTNNAFTGPVPPNLCFGKKLQKLMLGYNHFEGGIPSQLGKCATLTRVILKKNKLSGAIPDFVKNINPIFLDLSENGFSGKIPASLANLVNVTSIDLSVNKLSGFIPPELANLVNLQRLLQFDVSHHLLSGLIPSTFGSLGELSILSLSENNLSGGIPTSLFELEKLSELQLGGNALGGEIHQAIATTSRETLRLLNLSSNGLTGELPAELGKFTFLEKLDVAGNNITGTLRVLEGMRSLIFVNVSHNLFSGPVPANLMKFLNSTPTSFSGNLGLCVHCDPEEGSNCPENGTLRPCDLQSKNGRHLSGAETEMIALGVLLFTIFLLLVIAYMLLWRKNSAKGVAICAQEGASSLLNKVLEATENLNDKYVISRGAHGIVFKAILGPGKVYAVKKLVFVGIKDGSTSMVREIQTIGKNGAFGTELLLELLRGCHISTLTVILQSFIEISDFGIAKLLDQSGATSTSNTLQGTVGYMAPETAFAASKSKESDVYSYGVVLLELITRKKALDPSLYGNTDIVSWVRSIWTETEEIEKIVDPSLLDEFIDSSVMEQVIEVLSLALRCTEKDVSRRPSMKEVIKLLARSSLSIRSNY
ncbi:Receptor-like protein kinase [Capsicum annuum]|nr:Receptor-like protein kinase [Capsicum annuum]